MVALTAALGVFHVTQQTVHFRQGQTPIRTNRAVAGHGPEQLVQVRLNAVAGAELHQISQDVSDQPVGFGLLEQCRNLPYRQGFRAQTLQFKAQALEPGDMLLGAIGFTLTDGQGLRHQQRLAAQALTGHRHLQTLIHDPLVGGVHVHQHQALSVFRKNVDALELCQRITQRRDVVLPGR
ncbi:hypothetical protein D3C85_192580 [compost metagenome]